MVIVSGNLLPSYRQLFPALKRNLGWHKFENRQVETVVIQWLVTQNTDFNPQFVPPNYKYFSFGGSYVEMWWDSRAVVKSELFILCQFVYIRVKGSATAAWTLSVSPYKQLIFSTSKQLYTTTRVNLRLLKVYSLAYVREGSSPVRATERLWYSAPCGQDRKSTGIHLTVAFCKRNCKWRADTCVKVFFIT
jgi:hypothetical protein